jgi:hypothetical protein
MHYWGIEKCTTQGMVAREEEWRVGYRPNYPGQNELKKTCCQSFHFSLSIPGNAPITVRGKPDLP